MSPAAVTPLRGLRHDLAACERHLLTRLRLTAHDPFGIALLAFAGVVTVPLWGYWLGIHPHFSLRYPWHGWFFTEVGVRPTAAQLAFYLVGVAVAATQVLWAGIVSLALDREVVRRQSRGLSAAAVLPLGPRARAVADVMAALALAIVARSVLAIGWTEPARLIFGGDAIFPELAWLFRLAQLGEPGRTVAVYVSSLAMSTLLGVLLVFPLVLAFRTVVRFDWAGMLKPAIAAALLFCGLSAGAMARLSSALPLSLLVCAFLLVRVDGDGERTARAARERPLRFRASAGPLAQFRRDAWCGPLRERWLFLTLVVAGPLVPALIYRIQASLHAVWTQPATLPGAGAVAAALQWLLLGALPFLPLGLALVPASARTEAAFGGSFLRSWSALPVPRSTVLRTVYLHGLLSAGLAWLVLCAHGALLGWHSGVAQYELPVVLLLPALAICEAVGDRRRGLLALGALVAFQIGVPLAHAIGLKTLGLPALSHGAVLRIEGWALALVGIVPPLIHLRAPADPKGEGVGRQAALVR